MAFLVTVGAGVDGEAGAGAGCEDAGDAVEPSGPGQNDGRGES